MKMHRFVLIITLIIIPLFASGQEVLFSGNSFDAGLGIAINEGDRETGMGPVFYAGFQRGYFDRDRLRLGPTFTTGGFVPFFITDTRDQYYRVSGLSFNASFDLIRLGPISLVAKGGLFTDYSRGLLGTGGWPEANNNTSEYFYKFYYGATAGASLRFSSPARRVGYELSPFNFRFGPDYYFMASVSFGVTIKLADKSQ